MRVYTSKGFVDIPDTQSGGTAPTQGGTFAGGNVEQMYTSGQFGNPGSIGAGRYIEQIKGIRSLTELSADEQKKATAQVLAEKNISQLEKMYFNGKLYKGAIGGILAEIQRKINPGGSYDKYMRIMESMRPTFARAAGDVGNLSQTEQQAAAKNFPTARFTRKEARDMFNEARTRFGLPTIDDPMDNITNFAKNYYTPD